MRPDSYGSRCGVGRCAAPRRVRWGVVVSGVIRRRRRESSGVVTLTEDFTLRSDRPPYRCSRGRRCALSYRNAHRYAPVFLQRIKLPKGSARRQGGCSWAVMAQIDGRSTAMTKIRYRWSQVDVGSGRESEPPQGEYFPEDDGEANLRRSCALHGQPVSWPSTRHFRPRDLAGHRRK